MSSAAPVPQTGAATILGCYNARPINPLVIPYPEIDPVLVQLGPLAIRWYALAYIAGLVIGWQVIRRLCEQPPKVLTPAKIDDFLLWAALGVILGGRLGYVLFYKPGFYLANPLAILTLWEGGMSFHGGFLGVIVATIVFSLRNKTDPFLLARPFGHRVADRPVLRPAGQLHQRRAVGPHERRRLGHGVPARRSAAAPSQPALPGLLRGHRAVRRHAAGVAPDRRPASPRPADCGVFFAGYGVARIVGELFREPDAHLGYLWGPITMGMLLSVPLLVHRRLADHPRLRPPCRVVTSGMTASSAG